MKNKTTVPTSSVSNNGETAMEQKNKVRPAKTVKRICPRNHDVAKVCPTCKGEKKIQCETCYGTAEVIKNCEKCDGSGFDLPCSRCRGTGRSPEHVGICYMCSGSGSKIKGGRSWQWFAGGPCPECMGHRQLRYKCSKCINGEEECPTCDGKGYTCSVCKKEIEDRRLERSEIQQKAGLLALSIIGTDPSKKIWVKDDIPSYLLTAFSKRLNHEKPTEKKIDKSEIVAFIDNNLGFFDNGVGMLLTKTELIVTHAKNPVRIFTLNDIRGNARKKPGKPSDGTTYFTLEYLLIPTVRPDAVEVFIKGVWLAASALNYMDYKHFFFREGKPVKIDPKMETLLDTIKGKRGGPKPPIVHRSNEPDHVEPETVGPEVQDEVTVLAAPDRKELEGTSAPKRKWTSFWSLLVVILILAKTINYFSDKDKADPTVSSPAAPSPVTERVEAPPAEVAKTPVAMDPAPVPAVSPPVQAVVMPTIEPRVFVQTNDFPLVRQMMREAVERDEAKRLPLIDQILATEKPAAGDAAAAKLLWREAVEKGDSDKFEEGIRLLEQANKFDPSDTKVLGSLAFFLMETGNFRAAKARSFELLMLDPTISSAWAGMGVSMVKTGESEWAVLAILNSIKFSKDKETIHPYIALLIKDDANADLKKATVRAATLSLKK